MSPTNVEPEVTPAKRGMSRRQLIRNAGIAGAVAWTAPMIVGSLASPAAAGSVQSGCFNILYAPGNNGATCQTAGTATGCTPSGTSCASPVAAPAAILACITAVDAANCSRTTNPLQYSNSSCSNCDIVAVSAQYRANGSNNHCTITVTGLPGDSISITPVDAGFERWQNVQIILSCS